MDYRVLLIIVWKNDKESKRQNHVCMYEQKIKQFAFNNTQVCKSFVVKGIRGCGLLTFLYEKSKLCKKPFWYYKYNSQICI